MKSINLIPARNPNKQLRTWLALALIAALAIGALAGIYYYVDSIHTKAERYLAEARELEKQTAEFMEQAVPRASSNLVFQFENKLREAESLRVEWETYLQDTIQPLPRTAVLQAITSETNQSLLVRVDFQTYDEALAFIHRMEQLNHYSIVSVNTFSENRSDTMETVPVTDANGTVLYYDTTPSNKLIYSVDLRLKLIDEEASDDQQNKQVE